jgi:hypothetical protein
MAQQIHPTTAGTICASEIGGKMAYRKGASGYPEDPELKQLLSRLGELAARHAYYWQKNDAEQQTATVKEYHEVLARMYALGWDDIIDSDSELPYHLMPQAYGATPPDPSIWQRAVAMNAEQRRKQEAALAARSPWQRFSDWVRDYF